MTMAISLLLSVCQSAQLDAQKCQVGDFLPQVHRQLSCPVSDDSIYGLEKCMYD